MMSRLNDNEMFWEVMPASARDTQITPGDFENLTGYTRHRPKDTAMSDQPHNMTAMYVNECLEKHNGMELFDDDDDVWGWVYDQHKAVGKWVCAPFHDERVDELRKGKGMDRLSPTYQPYRRKVVGVQPQPEAGWKPAPSETLLDELKAARDNLTRIINRIEGES